MQRFLLFACFALPSTDTGGFMLCACRASLAPSPDPQTGETQRRAKEKQLRVSFLKPHSRNSRVYIGEKNSCCKCIRCICPWKRGGEEACLHCSSAWGSLTNGINEDVLPTPLQGNQQAETHSHLIPHVCFISPQ